MVGVMRTQSRLVGIIHIEWQKVTRGLWKVRGEWWGVVGYCKGVPGRQTCSVGGRWRIA
jgi:hypothetical protein